MIRRFLRDRTGATAIEFAIVAPVLLLIGFLMLHIGLAFWRWNTVETVARHTARCVAIGSDQCPKAMNGCVSATPGACYAMSLLASHAVPGLDPSAVKTEFVSDVGETTFCVVTISFHYTILEREILLSSSARFPIG